MKGKSVFPILIMLIFFASGCIEPKEEEKNPIPTITDITKPPINGTSIATLVFKAKVEVIPSGPPHIVSSKTVLDFGKLPPNMIERKEVLISNNRNFPVVVIPSANGSISNWLTFDKERIVIEAKGKNTSIVSIIVPKGVNPGNYTGYVVYKIFRHDNNNNNSVTLK